MLFSATSASTRRVYEIKLYELQTGEKPAPASPYPPVDEDDDKDTEQEVSFKQQPRQRTTKITPRELDNSTITQPSPRRPLHPQTEGAHKISSSTGGVGKSTSVKSSGGISVLVKILCIIIIAVFVFLVIKNMEADPGSSIPTVDL